MEQVITFAKTDSSKDWTGVYINGHYKGAIRKFCCGVDFWPNKRPNAIFSILSVKMATGEGEIDGKKLKECLIALCSIKIPNKKFHWDFRHRYLEDSAFLKDYEKRLNQIKS